MLIGEGALNALRGSSLGIGTDIGKQNGVHAYHQKFVDESIGGSVRIPAAFCGIYSVKPTHNRFSYRDVANTVRLTYLGFLDRYLFYLCRS